MSNVATQFAFSRNVFLHNGDVRTALFNLLFSEIQNGTFYLKKADFINKRKKNLYIYQLLN